MVGMALIKHLIPWPLLLLDKIEQTAKNEITSKVYLPIRAFLVESML